MNTSPGCLPERSFVHAIVGPSNTKKLRLERRYPFEAEFGLSTYSLRSGAFYSMLPMRATRSAVRAL